MARGKPPAFQAYPDAWLSSLDIQLMTPAEEGAYWRLLCNEWLQPDCGLPDNDVELAVLSRLGDQWDHGSGAKIRQNFRAQDGRLYNDRLLEERKKQKEWAKKSAEGGRKSAAAKKIRRSKGGSSLVATKSQPNGKGGSLLVDDCLPPNRNSSSSPSSSSSEPPISPPKGDDALWLSRFEEWWSIYPSHRPGKPPTKTFYRERVYLGKPSRKFDFPDGLRGGTKLFGRRHHVLIAATKARVASDERDQVAGKFVPEPKHATTYLNSGEWTEVPEEADQPVGTEKTDYWLSDREKDRRRREADEGGTDA